MLEIITGESKNHWPKHVILSKHEPMDVSSSEDVKEVEMYIV